MLSFAAFLAVIAATIISLDAVPTKLTQAIDIDSLLQSLQQQLEEEQSPPLRKAPKKQRLDDDDEEEESSFGRIRGEQLERLIKLAEDGGDETVYRESKKRKIQDEDRDDLNQRVLQQLDLMQRLQGQDRREKKRQSRNRLKDKGNRLPVNDLINPTLVNNRNRLLQALNDDDRNDDRDDDIGDLNQYSNVYVILNPESVDKSQNKNELNELLSNLLSPSSQKKYRTGKRDRRYKGFLLKDNNPVLHRRRGRESKEGNSMEKDYAPKRGRGRDTGGGGGRTAIPYIRHRGDIYEKDN